MMFVVAGGEAFLNPHAPEMLAYATQVFGRDAVSVTTNYSTFPEKTDEVVALLRRCGRPRLVLSIDRTHNVQHTKIQSNNLKKLQAILFATTKLGISVSAISTGVNAADVRRAKKFLLSKAILPYEFREDFLSPANIRRFRSDIRLLESGRVPIHQHPIEALGYDYAGDSKFPRVHIAFHNNGKAYFIAAPRLNLAPLAIGSWQREAMGDLLGPNLQLKSARILGWISGKRLEAKTVGGHSRLTSVSAKAQQEKFLRVVKRHLKREEDFRKGVRRLETNARKKQFGRIPLRVLH